MDKDILKGELTNLAEDELWDIESIDDIKEDGEKSFWDNNRYISVFSERVREKAIACGQEKDSSDLIEFLAKRVEGTGGDLKKGTIKNWLQKSPPDGSSRENVYQLCFALGLTERETAEFFMKAYWEHPFLFRRLEECVYWFCLKTGQPFGKAKELVERVRFEPEIGVKQEKEGTSQIEATLRQIKDEETLLLYLTAHRNSFEKESQTGYHMVDELLAECKDIANRLRRSGKWEPRTGDDALDNFPDVSSTEDLLEEIYGIRFRERYKGNDSYKGYSIQFPNQYVNRSFPQWPQFQEVTKRKASYDAVRKILILLCFYRFFAEAALHMNPQSQTDGDLYGQMEAETNEVLYRCGYAPLYVRNPYDWLFYHCATQDNPLAELRALIGEYWNPKR